MENVYLLYSGDTSTDSNGVKEEDQLEGVFATIEAMNTHKKKHFAYFQMDFTWTIRNLYAIIDVWQGKREYLFYEVHKIIY